jgi:hypothetical protein
VNTNQRSARGLRPRAFFFALPSALLLLAFGVAAVDAAPIHNGQRRPWASFLYGECRDDRVGQVVGMIVQDALKDIKPLRLMAVRVLDRWTPVNLEVVPERLTMVVHDNGVVVRAFCR